MQSNLYIYTVCNQKSVRFFAFHPQPPSNAIMPRLPSIPRQPLCEVSPNSRSRVVSAHEYGSKFADIARGETLLPSTCRQIVQNASIQTSCISQPRSGRPELISPRLGRQLFRAIAINPKITAAQLRATVAPEISKDHDLPIFKEIRYPEMALQKETPSRRCKGSCAPPMGTQS